MAELGLKCKEDLCKDGIDPAEYTLRKRVPKKMPKRKNDIYVNRKTNFTAQLARCQKLFDTGYNEIHIHGIGAAINRAITLALRLKEQGMGSLEVSPTTSTIELTDDFEPECDDDEPQTRTRFNSAIHIKVFRPEPPFDTELSNPPSQPAQASQDSSEIPGTKKGKKASSSKTKSCTKTKKSKSKE